LVAAVVAVGLEDLTCLDKNLGSELELFMDDVHKETTYLTDICVEPLSELLVLVGILNQGVGSVEDDIHALPVGKRFEEGPKFRGGSFQTVILQYTHDQRGIL
jgi:hypothetical protein